MAQAARELDRRPDLPLTLHKAAGVDHAIVFVAAQRAEYAKLGADKILIAAPQFVLNLAAHPRGNVVRTITCKTLVHPARVEAVETAIQVDHATGAGGTGLRPNRDRLILLDLALANISAHADLIGTGERVLEQRATLRLIG